MASSHSESGPVVEHLEVRAYQVPTETDHESDGTLEWSSTTMVLVLARGGGKSGIGYTYADVATARLIEHKLADVVTGRHAFDIAGISADCDRQCRNLGRPGIVSMAISAVDNALWDLKARIVGLSVLDLLGASRDRVPAYGSGGFCNYSDGELRQQLGGWAREGYGSVKMKVGREPEQDLHRAGVAREAIGDDVDLYVDANGAYDRKQALRFAEGFAELGVKWFEEPVSSDDLEGLHLLRDRGPAGMRIAAGEYGYDVFYFQRMLRSGAVDVIQADVTRCGGVTGFMKVAPLAQAHGAQFSAHCAPSLSATVCCAAPNAWNIEYFFDHQRIESMFFDGALSGSGGYLAPNRSSPGFGIELKEKEADRYRVQI